MDHPGGKCPHCKSYVPGDPSSFGPVVTAFGVGVGGGSVPSVTEQMWSLANYTRQVQEMLGLFFTLPRVSLLETKLDRILVPINMAVLTVM